MAHMYVQCVVVDWVEGMSWGLMSRLDENAVFMDNRKLEAYGYPDTKVKIIRGRWYIPTDHPFATWLMVKHNFPIRDIRLSLI